MIAAATSNYIEEAMRATSALAPPSLANNPGLLAWNLFVMTAAMCLGLDGGQAGAPHLGSAGDRSPDGPGFGIPLHRVPRGLRGF